jgi:glutamate racemase
MRLLVFDSGIGGIGIASAIRIVLPQAALTYVMDDAGFPYGARTEVALTQRVLQIVGAGIARVQPDLVVIACNTASTTALAALRRNFKLPFVGCVPPIKSAAAATRTRTIGVLATPATISGAYLRDLAAAHAPDCRVLIHGPAGLARLAEHRFAGVPVALADVQAELAGLLAQPHAAALDAVALGCTHYAILLDELRACLPPGITWHDPALPVARQAQRVAATLPGSAGAIQHNLVLHTGENPPAVGSGWQHSGFDRFDHLGLPETGDCAIKITSAEA